MCECDYVNLRILRYPGEPYFLSSSILSCAIIMGRNRTWSSIHRDRTIINPIDNSTIALVNTAHFIAVKIISICNNLPCNNINILSRLYMLYCEHSCKWSYDLGYPMKNTDHLIHGACPV